MRSVDEKPGPPIVRWPRPFWISASPSPDINFSRLFKKLAGLSAAHFRNRHAADRILHARK